MLTRRILTGAALYLSFAVVTVQAQDRSQSRSMVMSRSGIVASENVMASQAGAAILESGGNAFDAAVATNAVMGLVAPMNDGVGGDLFAIVYEAKTGKLYGLNASGWSPAALTADALLAKGMSKMPAKGIHSVTIPGTVDGWDKMLKRFGRKSFADVLAPAIAFAEDGFPVGEIVSVYWHDSEAILKADEAAARTYLVDGRAPSPGTIFRNPDLAWTYRQIAAGGRDAFYNGAVADRILATSTAHAGLMSKADLAEFESEWVEPISTTYHGWTVSELPPNGQGFAVLEMLNMMEFFPLAEYGHNSVRALHTMIEAKKLAYADILRYDADPRFARVPVEGLLSKSFAEQRAKLIDPERASCRVDAGLPPGTDNGTTYLSVIDRDGNMVSLIQSNFATVGFGSGLAVSGAGFALQNRGALFTLEKGHPNILDGRKRPSHTIIPAFMQKGDVRVAFGIMGGWNQAQAQAQFVSNVVDYGMNLQAALDAPRFSKETFPGCDVNLESRIPRHPERADCAWPYHRHAGRLFVEPDGFRAGRRGRCRAWPPSRRLRSAQGRSRGRRAAALRARPMSRHGTAPAALTDAAPRDRCIMRQDGVRETETMIIRDPTPLDEAPWKRLWAGYNAFYEVSVPEAVTNHTWQRLLDPASTIFARVADDGENVTGFAIGLLHAGTWTVEPMCCLEDLFVAPSYRGKGAGRRLIQDMVERASDRGCSHLYWHTRATNPARRLYDEFVKADDFVRYKLALDHKT